VVDSTMCLYVGLNESESGAFGWDGNVDMLVDVGVCAWSYMSCISMRRLLTTLPFALVCVCVQKQKI